MSDFDMYLENISLFLTALGISLTITILAYAAFPVILAKTRKKTITKKKYKRLCYGLNIIALAFFIAISGGAVSTGGPYLLWTWVFSKYGLKKLNKKGLLVESIPGKKKASAIVGIENSAQTKENLSAKVEESKKSTKVELKVKANRYKKFVSFFKSRKKIFFILAGVSVALLLASLIGMEIIDSLWFDAIAHYEDTLTRGATNNQWIVGCGQYACKYCDGAKKVTSWTNCYAGEDFTYYRTIRTLADIFGICIYVFLILSIILAIISLLLIIIPLVVGAKRTPKTVPQTTEEQNISLFGQKKKIHFCKYCGGKIDSDSMFCPYCGKKL